MSVVVVMVSKKISKSNETKIFTQSRQVRLIFFLNLELDLAFIYLFVDLSIYLFIYLFIYL